MGRKQAGNYPRGFCADELISSFGKIMVGRENEIRWIMGKTAWRYFQGAPHDGTAISTRL